MGTDTFIENGCPFGIFPRTAEVFSSFFTKECRNFPAKKFVQPDGRKAKQSPLMAFIEQKGRFVECVCVILKFGFVQKKTLFVPFMKKMR